MVGADAAAGLRHVGAGRRARRARHDRRWCTDPGFDLSVVPTGFTGVEVEVPALDVSSSDIRARLATGRPIDVLVPAAAATWLARHRIYPCEG